MKFVCGVNAQLSTGNPGGLPFLWVLDDWDNNPPVGATEYRLMNRSAYSLFPAETHVVIGNEDDDEGPAGWDGQTLDQQPASVQSAYAGDNARWQLQHLWDVRRAWRLPLIKACHDRGLRVHCPAERPFERNQYDPQEVAACDVVDFHVAVFEVADLDDAALAAWVVPLNAIAQGKPKWCSEIEADPAVPEQMAAIPRAAARLRDAGFEAAFAWGSDLQLANVNNYPEILAQLKALNGTPIPIQEELTMEVVDVTTAQQETDQNSRQGDLAQAAYNQALAFISQNAGSLKPDVIDKMWGGPLSVFGQLNATDNQRFPVPPRP